MHIKREKGLTSQFRQLNLHPSKTPMLKFHQASNGNQKDLFQPFRWVKYSPIFQSNLVPLNQGQYSPIT